jgi:peptidoglycan hydrolase FlgJ
MASEGLDSVKAMRDFSLSSKLLSEKMRSQTVELNNLKSISDPKLQLKRVAEEMESIFVKMMYTQMKKNTFKTGFIDGGHAEKIFDDMLTDEYAKTTSRESPMGIAKMIYDQYSKFV